MNSPNVRDSLYPYLVLQNNAFTKSWQNLALFKSAVDAKLFVRARCQVDGEPETIPKYRVDFVPEQPQTTERNDS